ncbi:hypothetical protein E2320_009259 [Naja naja]|nr:hypothetical protein E2320_009259 [Naja naja]
MRVRCSRSAAASKARPMLGVGVLADPKGDLYKDLAFPASDDSLFFNCSTPLAQFKGEIYWLRPQEICSSPRLFSDNQHEWQVKQGMLGDCWFLCACAALQKNKYLLTKVIPPGQPSWKDEKYRGCFTCRIWQFGHWVEVTIDDRLPCLGGKLCFSQCQTEDVADALVDLTGGLAERWSLKDLSQNPERERAGKVLEKTVFRQLMNLKEKCVMSCSVFSSRQGPGWNQLDPVVGAELLSQLQEGDFWAEEEEFFMEFDEVITGYPVTEEGQLQSLYTDRVLSHTQKLYGSWVRGQSAGGCRNNSTFPTNPKFWLRVCEQSELCIALLQKPRKHSTDWAGRIRAWPRLPEADPSLVDNVRGKNYHAVGLHIWKVHLHCELSPGYYLVVPSTFLNNTEGNFLLRVFSSGRISLSEIKLPLLDNTIHEAFPGGEWETAQLEGSWKKGHNAGGSRNFPRSTPIPASLCRFPPGLVKEASRCPSVSTAQITSAVPSDNNHVKMASTAFLQLEPVLSCVPHCYSQEISQTCRLPSGNYAIVPSTYLPDTEGSFTEEHLEQGDFGTKAAGGLFQGCDENVILDRCFCCRKT